MWWFFALALVVSIPVALASRAERRRRREALAAALGFAFQSGSWSQSEEMIGTRRGLPVTLRWVTRGSGRNQKRYTQWNVGGAHPGLTLKNQGLGNELLRRVSGGQDLIVGDPDFDENVIVQGEPVEITTLLDGPARRGIRSLPDGAEIKGGSLTWETEGEPDDPQQIAWVLDEAVTLVSRLADPHRDRVDRLAAIAVGDVQPGVRRRALRALAAASAAAAAGIARHLAEDVDLAVRAQAALLLGEPEALLKLPDSAVRTVAEEAPDPVARAFVRVRGEAALLSLLSSESAAVRIAAARGLARVGTTRAVEPLLALTRGILGDNDVRAAARSAVASIQARAVDGDAGQVSIVEESGQVSVAHDAGRVSVARTEGPVGSRGRSG